ncbi:MAG: hypothetical protein U7123_03240 [Potamolinea sp.]
MRELLKTDRVLIFRFQADGSGVVEVESVGAEFPAILNQNIHDPCFKAPIGRCSGSSSPRLTLWTKVDTCIPLTISSLTEEGHRETTDN